MLFRIGAVVADLQPVVDVDHTRDARDRAMHRLEFLFAVHVAVEADDAVVDIEVEVVMVQTLDDPFGEELDLGFLADDAVLEQLFAQFLVPPDCGRGSPRRPA